MNESCIAVTVDDEFVVETWSGDDTNKICSLRGQPTARHNVIVGNLKLYPTKRIKCEGFVRADEPVIEFLSDNARDTAVEWADSINWLVSGGTYTFSPCVLQAIEGKVGVERIDTVVTVDWYPPGKSQTIRLSIEVSTG